MLLRGVLNLWPGQMIFPVRMVGLIAPIMRLVFAWTGTVLIAVTSSLNVGWMCWLKTDTPSENLVQKKRRSSLCTAMATQ